MDYSDVNKIRFGNDYWFYVHHNKIVIGGNFLGNENHLTFSFGNESGYFDLHLTKNLSNNEKRYFPVLKISHVDFLKLYDTLILRIFETLFGEFKPFDDNWLIEQDVKIWPLRNNDLKIVDEFDKAIEFELFNMIRKKSIRIDKDSAEFLGVINKLSAKYNNEWKKLLFKPEIIKTLGNGFGLLIFKNEVRVYYRINTGEGFKNYSFDQMNLDLGKTIKGILGDDLHSLLSSQIIKGIDILNSPDYETSKDSIVETVLTITS